MGKQQDILIPDIGGAEDVDVIEVLVSVGDTVDVDDALVTLESDKASMDIPAPVAGTVKKVYLSVGDKVSEGAMVIALAVEAADAPAAEVSSSEEPASEPAAAPAVEEAAPVAAAPAEPSLQKVEIPDIGTTDDVDVIEVNVAVGDTVDVDDALITLEGDKATMDIPSPFQGEIKTVEVAVGDKVKQGSLVVTMMGIAAEASAPNNSSSSQGRVEQNARPELDSGSSRERVGSKAAVDAQPGTSGSTAAPSPLPQPTGGPVYAGPAVRRFARELGVDLTRVGGSGRKGRIVKEDVQAFVKAQLQGGGGAGGELPALAGLQIAAAKPESFDKFGEIETVPLSKIQKISGSFLHRNWLRVPHVTQFDETDITELEAFRKQHKEAASKQGVKLTPLAFLMKAAVVALQAFPEFNASLDHTGENMILKKYFNIGVAVDTPNGLVVPVIRDVDKKGVMELAKELAEISTKAREKGLSPAEMSGSTFTISSLGGIGGTNFTPIVNLPNVCILGVSRSSMKPVYDGEQFVPRLMLPLSLSYDHRIIDGASGARFTRYVCECISDLRHAIL